MAVLCRQKKNTNREVGKAGGKRAEGGGGEGMLLEAAREGEGREEKAQERVCVGGACR